MIAMNVHHLDPGIAYVNKKLVHPLKRDIVINIIHAEPIKILMDACLLGITNIMAIEKAF
jgi:hypothetical protein